MIAPAWIDWSPLGVRYGVTETTLRVCAELGCGTRLSRFNDAAFCGVHQVAPERRVAW